MNNAIEKELSDSEKSKGITRKWIPAIEIIKDLKEIRDNSKLWEVGGISGADQYQGLPAFIRNIDAIIEKLK